MQIILTKICQFVFSTFKSFAIIFFITILLLQFIKPTIVNGQSMTSTLDNRDYLLLNRIPTYTNSIKKGDIIVFESNINIDNPKSVNTFQKILNSLIRNNTEKKLLIKRLIANENDTIEIKNEKVYINNHLINELYIDKGNKTFGNLKKKVPKGHIFCMGDNRENSMDSRYPEVGFVPKDKIIGVLMIRILPFNAKHFVK